MREKRKLTRLKLLYHLRVFDRDTFRLLGYLADIHTEGMSLISEKLPEVDKTHSIRIMLPEKINDQDEIHFSARLLWRSPFINPLFYQAGFKIQHIEKRYVRCLEALIFNYGFRNIFHNKAVRYYRGIEGYNCAQSILKVFQDRLDISENQISTFADYGGGKAEDGICGALYAVKQLAGNAELIQKIVQQFKEEVGTVYCDEILELGRLSCTGCICTAAEIFQRILDGV
jgi:hypothetical protein